MDRGVKASESEGHGFFSPPSLLRILVSSSPSPLSRLANKGTDAWDPGGVWGKTIDAQSIVVASTATGWYGHEGSILRYVFWHSIILAALVGVLTFLHAYVWPSTLMVP